jgi:hypothetical protein
MPKNYLIVCNDHFNFGFPTSFAESHGYSWVPDCEVVYRSVDKVANDPRKKIAIVEVFQTDQFKDCSWADLVIGYTPEIVSSQLPPDKFISDLQQQTKCSQAIVLAGGVPNFWPPHHKVYATILSFFDKVYAANQDLQLNQLTQRDFLFEALLGQATPSRCKLSEWIQQSDFIDKTLLSVSGSQGPEHFYRTSMLDQLDHAQMALVSKPELNDNSANWFYQDLNNNFFGTKMPVNIYIPKAIYENSWYSIVAETNPTFGAFFTEKTAKAIYGQRVFILFGGYRSLFRLRELGYRTFENLIDESYDEIPDHNKRWQCAWQTVESLAKMDPQLLYSQAQEILVHNYQLIRNIGHRHRPIQNFISSWLPG